MEEDTNESMSVISSYIVIQRRGRNHFFGSSGEYEFLATFHHSKIACGLMGSRFVEVCVFQSKEIDGQTWRREVGAYDRGWKKKPESEHEKKVFASIFYCLENLPPDAFNDA